MYDFIVGRAGAFGNYANSYGGYETNPYYPSFHIDAGAAVSSLVTAPVRLSMYYNIAHAAFHGSRAIGLTSSLKDPFTASRLLSRYKSRTVHGLTRDALNIIPPQAPDTFTGKIAHAVFGTNRNARWYEPVIRQHTQERFDAFVAAKPMGLLDRYLLRPNAMDKRIRDIIPALADDRGIAKEVASRLYSKDHAMSKYRGITGRFRERAQGLHLKKSYLEAQQRSTITLWDILSGKKGKGTSYGSRVLDTLVGEESVLAGMRGAENGKTFQLMLSRSRRKTLQFHEYNAAILDAAKSMGAARNELIAAQKIAEDQSVQILKRIRNARVVKTVAGGALALSVVGDIFRGGMQMATEGFARSASTLRSMTRTDFGHDVLDTARSASERQRAVEAIQNAQLNARYLLGNEASIYH